MEAIYELLSNTNKGIRHTESYTMLRNIPEEELFNADGYPLLIDIITLIPQQ